MSTLDEKIDAVHADLIAYVGNDMALLERAMDLVEQDLSGHHPNIEKEFDTYKEVVKWIDTIRNRRRMESDAIIQ